MPTFSLDDLTTPMTRAGVQRSIYAVFAVVGVDTTSWKPGAVVRTMVVAVSLVLAALSKLQSRIARSGFLELSEGEWLTLVAHYVYGTDRIEAAFASGVLTLTNGGGGVFVLDADDLIFVNSSTGKTYRNTSAVSLGALATVDIPILATEAGSTSSAGSGDIDTLSTTLLGVTCANAVPLVGLDAEPDPALRLRCYEKLGALSPMGPWDAYASALRNAVNASGQSLGITRTRVTKDGTGRVDVYAATAAGVVAGDVDDPATPLGIADRAIQEWATPLAVTAYTHSAENVPIEIEYTAWMYNTSGQTDAAVAELIRLRLVAFMSSQPIGGNIIAPGDGYVFVDGIRATIASTLPEIFHVVVDLPAADVALELHEVAVLGLPTPTIVQVPPPEGFSP